ncbi:MAG: SH3 domain-containing protein [Candidatus Thiocaldithrix dubininis]|uniref:SH3 domain-containing protein n=1 Tax=Candidatus Thiocaldithrix dubininis TaxID=3080823 RepID=A0AA95H7Q0_9GAMM|nr:MAG: SH3 domain-containing protein [Candidatus Thiocaldithrix dubininis]
MKPMPTLLMFAALLSLSIHSQAASFNCAKAKSYSEKEVCDSKQLSKLDEDLDKVFKKVLATTSDKASLKTEQADWLKEREACSDKSCITDVYQSRIEELNTQLENVSDSRIASDSVSLGWYKALAKPNLVVRLTPSVTGEKMGNVPVDGKVNVIATTGKADSIGGREGQWVKIQWQGKEGYVFSAFISKLSSNSESSTRKPSKSTSKTLSGKIAAYECGDNCYLTIKDSQGTEHSGLCTASACDKWNENAEMPSSFIGKKVKITVGRGKQVDGAGNIMGEMDAFDKIEMLN